MDNFKLYVGNVSFDMTSDQLGQLFAEAGDVVDAKVITDRQTGRSRGFGFVEMASEEAMNKAIEMFNAKDVQGRALVVSKAKPREERPEATQE